MESLLAETPHNHALLTAAARGFTQYSYGWIDSDADPERAKHLYLRARDYGMRALAESIDNFAVRMASDPKAAMRLAKKRDVEALYWTASAWGLAIARSKDDLDLLGDLPAVEALITRAAELDPTFGDGAIDTFLMTYEASRSGVSKESEARAREHFRLATERSKGLSASPYVAAAEAFAIPAQDRGEFEKLLARAANVDPNARPEWRLENILAQRRAQWLLAHADDFFIDAAAEVREGGRR
jgi:predicted anti-sigma-YlaC factor YlaD